MSNHELGAAERLQRARPRTPLRAMRALVAGGALLLGLGGVLTACGDDDGEASETVSGQTDEPAAVSSAPAATGPGTTDATSTTRGGSTTTARPTTTARATTTTARATTTTARATSTTRPASGTGTAPATGAATQQTAETAPATAADADTSAPATDAAGTAADTSVPATDAAGTAAGTSAPPSSEPASSVPSSGPTTTGGECEFTENDELPIQRCDAGPPVAALQSVLQTLEYEVGTVDCFYGDQTMLAVEAFQTDEELPVTGVVDEDTWAAIAESFLSNWGTDTNGNDVVDPNEITIECS